MNKREFSKITDFSAKAIAARLKRPNTTPEELAETERILEDTPEVLNFFVLLFSIPEDERDAVIRKILAKRNEVQA